MDPIKRLTFIAVIMAIAACCTAACGQPVTNILDTFDRNGPLAGSAPDIVDSISHTGNWTYGGPGWNTTNSNGGALIVSGTANGIAKLNFTPQNGYIYTLSLIQNILGPAGTTDRWGMVGFDNGSATSQPYSASGPWMLVKYSGRLESYINGTVGDIISANGAGNAAGTNNLLQIVLNTIASNWQAQVWLNGVEEGVTNLPAGWQITQVMIGSFGAVTITNQNFSVVGLPPSFPAILRQPVGFTNTLGASESLSPVAYGAGPLYYQWFDNGLPLAGATNLMLSFPGLVYGDSGSYQLIVSNSFGSVTSSVANVLVRGSIFTGALPATGTDAASGISSTNTYLCALDFGSDTAPLAINGVQFQPVAPAGAGAGTDNNHPLFSGTDSYNGGGWSLAGVYTGGLGLFATNLVQSQADGAWGTLLDNYTAFGGTVAAGSFLTLTCGGLVPGGQYALRLYYSPVGSGTPVNFTFNGRGYDESYGANPVDLDSGGAIFVEYDFAAAGSNVTASVVAAENAGVLRIQAATLQIVQASPAVSDAALVSDAAAAGALIAASDAAQGTTNWSAHWISPSGGRLNEWLCYRKTFSLPQQPASAVARIAVDSKYWLWVNGQMVVREGELKRGPTPGDTWYDAIDLAPYLQSGSNTIALLQWYFGKSGESHLSSGVPGLIFEMDAGDTTILSDTSWRMTTNSAFQLASVVPQPRLASPNRVFAMMHGSIWGRGPMPFTMTAPGVLQLTTARSEAPPGAGSGCGR